MKIRLYGIIIFYLLLAISTNAQVFLKVDEAQTKAEFVNNQLQTDLVIENSGQNLTAKITLEILDANDKILGGSETSQLIKRGRQTLPITVAFIQKETVTDLLWKRLRYRIAPENSAVLVENIVSLSEIMPEVFDLQISAPEKIFAGMSFRAHVLALHPVSKKPIKNVEITSEIKIDLETNADEDKIILKANGKTNSEGFTTLEFKIPANVRLDSCCNEIKIKGIKNGIVREADDDFEIATDSFVYVNTDKPIYQPAQKLFVRGLYLNSFKFPLADKELKFEIEDEEGETVYEGTAKTSRFGVMNFEWQIPANFKLGTYTIEIENDDNDNIGAAEFKVSRYDLPNFKVETKTDKTFYLPDQMTANIIVNAAYLFGKPVAAGKVKIVQEKERRWNYEEQKYETETGAGVEGKTDADGKFTAKLDLSEAQKALQNDYWKRFADLKYAAYFTDSTTNRTEQKRFDVRISKEPIHIYFIRQASDANPKIPFLFYISTFYADGTPAKCDLKIEGNYNQTTLQTKLAEAKTNAYGASKFEVRFPDKPIPEAKSDFDFRVFAEDKKGNRGTFSDNVYVDESKKQLRVATDKTIYSANDAIETKIFSTENNQTIFLDVLRNGSVIYSKRIKSGDGRANLLIPFRPDFKGELTIAAYFKDEDSESYRDYVSSSKTILFPAPNNLNLNLKSLKAVYRPNEDAKISFNVQNGERKPLETALGVVILDKAIEERARTEQLPDNFGMIRKLLGTEETFGNLTRKDLDNLDPTKPVDADLQLAAEFLLVGKNFEPNFFNSDSYQANFREIYKDYFSQKLETLEKILLQNYEKNGEFPTDENSLRQILAANGVNFDELRDAWNSPFRANFSADRAFTTVILQTASADKKFDTDDDFSVKQMRFEWFKSKQNELSTILNNYLNSDKNAPQTAEELKNIWKQNGVDVDAMRDGWNRLLYISSFKYNRNIQKSTLETIGNLDGEKQQVVKTKLVEQEVVTYKLQSAGNDGVQGETDDFDLATFTVVLAEKDLSSEKTLTTVSKSPISNSRGAIGGTITDANGAIVPGAQVTAVNQNSQEEFSVKSNDNGEFLIANLLSGKYKVTAESVGFRNYIIENIVVTSMNLLRLEISLDVGGTTATVDVSADVSVLETQSSSMSKIVTKSEQKSIAGFLGNNKNAPSFTPRVREYFPETLLWNPELITNKNGKAELNFKLGDNLTTWKLYAVGSTETGEIGLIEKEFQTFQPFFAELDPPKILTTGDEISLPVPIRNYTDKKQKVAVSMAENIWSKNLNNAMQNIEIAPNTTQNAIFGFRAVSAIKDGKQKVSALAKTEGDAIEKPVTVRPNGKEFVVAQSNLFEKETAFDVNFPADALTGSRQTELKIYSNMLAHVSESVEGLLKRPYGCGEQTTSSTYPNLMILKIEKQFGKPLDAKLKTQAKSYLDEGYKRLLNYQTASGGFSYWGKNDTPNAALTAYILRFLTDAKEFTEVDETVIENAEKWLLSQQKTDGSWNSSKGNTDVSTAYIARSLAMLDDKNEESKKSLQAGITFLRKRLTEINDSFVLANLALTAQKIGDEETAQKAVEILQNLAQTENDMTFWESPNTPFYGWGKAAEIETTALVIQAFLESKRQNVKGKDEENYNNLISRGTLFLLKNKDRYGVWYSTQTTVNVLNTLILLQKMQNTNSNNEKRKIEIFVNGAKAQEFEVSDDGFQNPFILDVSTLANQSNNRVEIKTSGSAGFTMAQIVSVFYIDWKTAKNDSDYFDFKVEFDKINAKIGEEIVCKVGIARKINRYGMILAEIGIPPGADVDRASLENAKANGEFSTYDILPDKVLIYFWSSSKGLDFSFKFKPRYGINAQNAPSMVYDYYNEEAKAILAPMRFEVK